MCLYFTRTILSRLVADSTQSTGLKWGAAASSGPAFRAYTSSETFFSASTWTKISYNAEDFDTDSCFNTSNGRFTANKAGKYFFQVTSYNYSGGGSTQRQLALYKNGSEECLAFDLTTSQNNSSTQGAGFIDLNGSTDYVEAYIWMPGSSPKWASGRTFNYFSGFYVRS